jgi:hypothetical protein
VPDANPVRTPELSGIILMGSSLDIGPKRPALLRSPSLKETLSILYENGALYVKQGADKTPLPLNHIQKAGDVSITVRRR